MYWRCAMHAFCSCWLFTQQLILQLLCGTCNITISNAPETDLCSTNWRSLAVIPSCNHFSLQGQILVTHCVAEGWRQHLFLIDIMLPYEWQLKFRPTISRIINQHKIVMWIIDMKLWLDCLEIVNDVIPLFILQQFHQLRNYWVVIWFWRRFLKKIVDLLDI